MELTPNEKKRELLERLLVIAEEDHKNSTNNVEKLKLFKSITYAVQTITVLDREIRKDMIRNKIGS
jgi:hypothetical protein